MPRSAAASSNTTSVMTPPTSFSRSATSFGRVSTATPLVLDREKRIFADPDKVRRVEYDGKYYSCTAYVPTLPSPQGRPVIFQAGSSGRGMAFAARHAEGVFAIQTDLAGMQRYMRTTGEAAAKQGKPAEDMRVTFGLQAVLGGTEAEARRKAEEQRASVPLDGAMARLSSIIGIDFGQFDPDALCSRNCPPKARRACCGPSPRRSTASSRRCAMSR